MKEVEKDIFVNVDVMDFCDLKICVYTLNSVCKYMSSIVLALTFSFALITSKYKEVEKLYNNKNKT